MEEISDTELDALSSTSTECDCFSESQDTIDNLLDSMDEQINDLYAIVKTQKEEIEQLKSRIENLKSIITSHLSQHINNIMEYI